MISSDIVDLGTIVTVNGLRYMAYIFLGVTSVRVNVQCVGVDSAENINLSRIFCIYRWSIWVVDRLVCIDYFWVYWVPGWSTCLYLLQIWWNCSLVLLWRTRSYDRCVTQNLLCSQTLKTYQNSNEFQLFYYHCNYTVKSKPTKEYFFYFKSRSHEGIVYGKGRVEGSNTWERGDEGRGKSQGQRGVNERAERGGGQGSGDWAKAVREQKLCCIYL